MPDNTLTLVLSGDVSLANFATAISRFRSLVDALSDEIASGVAIDWGLNDLNYGSATTTVRGVTSRPETSDRVIQVIRAYERVGMAAENGEPIPFSDRVQDHVAGLTSILNGHIESITFETAEREAVIRSPFMSAREPELAEISPSGGAYGAITGRVQTLTNRGALRFTLFDLLHDKAVSCYLAEGQELIMRNVWGKLANVEGLVRRDPLSGRPMTIRHIQRIQRMTESDPRDYERARGVVKRKKGSRSPEEIIGQLRDA